MSDMNHAIDFVATLAPSGKIERPAGYFTVAEFAVRTGTNEKSARGKLLKLYREGKIIRVAIIEDGHLVNVYGLRDDSPHNATRSAE